MLERAAFTFIFFVGAVIAAESPKQILAKAEEKRNPTQNYKVHCVLVPLPQKKEDVRTYDTYISRGQKTIVEFLTPAIDKGKRVLLVDNQMWIHMPTISNPMRISPRQRLAGDAVYGDIARLSFIDNYSVKIKGQRKEAGKNYTVLELTALPERAVSYDRVEHWVEEKTYRPFRTEYQTMNGKKLRVAKYENFKAIFGVDRPTRIVFSDALTGSKTRLDLKNYKKFSMPEIAFDKNNLGRSLSSFR